MSKCTQDAFDKYKQDLKDYENLTGQFSDLKGDSEIYYADQADVDDMLPSRDNKATLSDYENERKRGWWCERQGMSAEETESKCQVHPDDSRFTYNGWTWDKNGTYPYSDYVSLGGKGRGHSSNGTDISCNGWWKAGIMCKRTKDQALTDFKNSNYYKQNAPENPCPNGATPAGTGGTTGGTGGTTGGTGGTTGGTGGTTGGTGGTTGGTQFTDIMKMLQDNIWIVIIVLLVLVVMFF